MPTAFVLLGIMALCCHLVIDRLLVGIAATAAEKAATALIIIVLVLLFWFVIPIHVG